MSWTVSVQNTGDDGTQLVVTAGYNCDESGKWLSLSRTFAGSDAEVADFIKDAKALRDAHEAAVAKGLEVRDRIVEALTE